MTVVEISYNSKEYRETLKLRNDILRLPLGKQLSSEDTLGEEAQFHFGYYDDGRLFACVVAKPYNSEANIKIRQMAVVESKQGSGIGKSFLLDVEMLLKKKGFNTLELSARKEAQGFYIKLAYNSVGSYYVEQGIKHIKMIKVMD